MSEEKKCPKCGKTMVLRKTKTGVEFYGCSGYPDCKYTEDKDQKFTTCEKCGKECKIFTYKDKTTGKLKKAYACECGFKQWNYKE